MFRNYYKNSTSIDFRGRIVFYPRITSYNVCYTKLLRACLGEAEKSLISITDLANTVIDLEKLKIYDAGIALETDLQTTPMVLVEKNSMVQAFLHLLVNARHALIGRSKPLVITSYSIHYTKLYES